VVKLRGSTREYKRGVKLLVASAIVRTISGSSSVRDQRGIARGLVNGRLRPLKRLVLMAPLLFVLAPRSRDGLLIPSRE